MIRTVVTVLAVWLALSIAFVGIWHRMLAARRAEAQLWHDADVERAAQQHRLPAVLIAEAAARSGLDPDTAARALIFEAELRHAFDVGAAANELDPELRRRDDDHR